MLPLRGVLSSWLGLLLAVVLLSGSVRAEEQSATKKKEPEAKVEKTKFVRVIREDGMPTAMQTAIVRYSKKLDDDHELTVDLVGAVHVGDEAYYKQLNRQFKEYDALLYELVAPEGTKIPKGGRTEGSSHPVSMLQDGMKETLELEHQLSVINYRRKNFVHADMSPEEFADSMEERGESVWQMFFRMMGHSIAQQSQNPRGGDVALLAAMFSSNRPLALKRAMAEQFEDLEGSMSVFDGPEGSTIITERNKVCLEVLQEQIDAGKTHLGIFYGAGHLPDMEKRLIADFGLTLKDQKWVTAWDMSGKKK